MATSVQGSARATDTNGMALNRPPGRSGMGSVQKIIRRVALAMVLLLCLGEPAQALAAVVLGPDSAPVIDVWSDLKLLVDPSHQLTLDQVQARSSDFQSIDSPHMNLGPRREALWLRLPIQVQPEDSGRWVFSIEYASLDRVDLYILSDHEQREPVHLGRQVPFVQRPFPSAWHATPLALSPGRNYVLLMRIETQSTAVIPITLLRPDRFHALEAQTQVRQGLLAGLGLCLLIYSLAQWVSIRDEIFLHYALTTFGTTLFFVAYSGLGTQHLWPHSQWLAVNAAPFFVLLALIGGFFFVDRVLTVKEFSPVLSGALNGGANIAVLVACLLCLGLVGYRPAQLVATLLGPLPMLLAIPAAYRRVRSGERIGAYILSGWGAYAIAAMAMVGLLRGLIPSTFWTLNAFQFGAVFEMIVWMRVLGVRIEEIQAAAQRAHLERDTLRKLAVTDPLTGLPNRRGLTDALEQVLPYAATDSLTAIYLIDLDGFKPVNDRLGHDAGDEVLVGAASRLSGLLRADDIVARLGGDEFVVVVSALANDLQAQEVGTRILSEFQKPFLASGQDCHIGLTIGYALAPLDGRGANDLLKRADAAMYGGKELGGGQLRRGAASIGMSGDLVIPLAPQGSGDLRKWHRRIP